jgi:hypothetical protein
VTQNRQLARRELKRKVGQISQFRSVDRQSGNNAGNGVLSESPTTDWVLNPDHVNILHTADLY